MKRFIAIGDKFNRLTVIKKLDRRGRNSYWLCQCTCGNTVSVRSWCLSSGNTQSCKCLARELKVKRNWLGSGKLSKTVFNVFTRNAKRREIEFKLTIGYLSKLFDKQNGKCAITQEPLRFGAITKDKRTASLDRINSEHGYIKGNVWWVHRDINKMKSDIAYPRFIELCNKVSTLSKLIK